MNKFTSMTLIALLGMASANLYADESKIPSLLEISDPDLAGGTYDARIEMQKKVSQLEDLQMTPEQYNTVKDLKLRQERAAASPYTSTAIPVTRSLNVKFASGLTPPIVRLSSGMLTTIVFTDGAGNPWNIDSVALNRLLFSDGADVMKTDASSQDPTNQGGNNLVKNILSIEPLNPVAYGNVIVTLVGLDKPIILMLSTGQQEVDMRVDARISGVNPNRPIKSSSSGLTTEMDDATLLFVDGTPPDTSERMKTSSNDIKAWRYNDELIVRTERTIIYPAYLSSVTSSSGISVYRFDSKNQSVTVSDSHGQPLTIYIEQE